MRYIYRFLFFIARPYWFIVKPKVHGAGVVIEKNGHVLLIRQTYGDRKQWHLPGGYIKRGESDEVAAVREVAEEVGLNLKITMLGNVQAIENHRLVDSACFYGSLEKQKIIPNKYEVEEVKLWPIDKLPSISPITKESVNLFLSKVDKH